MEKTGNWKELSKSNIRLYSYTYLYLLLFHQFVILQIFIVILQSTINKLTNLDGTSEYALRAVICLAQHPGELHTATKIAKLTKVPDPYLSKVLLTLAKHEV